MRDDPRFDPMRSNRAVPEQMQSLAVTVTSVLVRMTPNGEAHGEFIQRLIIVAFNLAWLVGYLFRGRRDLKGAQARLTDQAAQDLARIRTFMPPTKH